MKSKKDEDRLHFYQTTRETLDFLEGRAENDKTSTKLLNDLRFGVTNSIFETKGGEHSSVSSKEAF